MSIYEPATEGTTSRRGLLRRVSGATAGIFAAFAATAADAEGAWFYRCCTLARSNHCSGCGSPSANFGCPAGYTQRRWYCCTSGDLVMCGECTKASNCYNGAFACSCGSTTDRDSNFCF